MTISILESFGTIDWTAVLAAQNIVADTTHFMVGTQGIKFDKTTTTDGAAIYKAFTRDLTRFYRSFINAYISTANLSDITSFVVTYSNSTVIARSFWDWQNNYTASVEPPSHTPAYALQGVDHATASGGNLRIVSAGSDQCWYNMTQTNLQTEGEWGDTPNDYNWGVFKVRCKVDTGIPTKNASMGINYDGAQILFHFEDDQLRVEDAEGEATVAHDTTSDYVTATIYVSNDENRYYIEVDGDIMFEGEPYDATSGFWVRFGANMQGLNNTALGQNWEYARFSEIHKNAIYGRWVFPTNILKADGFNKLVMDTQSPDLRIGAYNPAALTHVGFGYTTQYYADAISSPTFDKFAGDAIKTFTDEPTVVMDWEQDNQTLSLAKQDILTSDGSNRWDGRVLSFGTLSRSISGQLGNYDVSDMSIQIENASGFMGANYDDEELALFNTGIEIKYGMPGVLYGDYQMLFKGAVKNVQFEEFTCKVAVQDNLPSKFNRLPNQFITEDSFPNAPDESLDRVAAIIVGEVNSYTGALPATPVDFDVDVVLNTNDYIDFKYNTTTYACQLTVGSYTDPSDLAAHVTTKMEAQSGVNTVLCSYDSTSKKFTIAIRNTGETNTLDILWNKGTNASKNSALLLGFNRDDDSTDSGSYKGDHEALNVYVVARHPCYESDNAQVYIDNVYVGSKSASNITFDFDFVTLDPIVTVTTGNNFIDFTDDDGTFAVQITTAVYNNGTALASIIQTALNGAASTEVYTCTFSESTQKYTITNTTGALLSLLWNTGTNSDETIGSYIGFDTSANDTGALFYISDDAVGINRWTTVTLNHRIAGTKDITINIDGITDDNTPTGDLVTNPVEAFETIITRFTDYPASLIDDDKFYASKIEAAKRAFTVAGAVTEDMEWDSFIEEYSRNFRMDVFTTKEGKLGVDFFQVEILDSQLDNLTDITDFIDGTYNYDANFVEIVNRIRYEYKYNFATDEFELSGAEKDSTSITKAKRVYDWPEGTLQLKWARDYTTAQRVVAGQLALLAGPTPQVEVVLPMSGWDLDLTDKINTTNAAAPYANNDTLLDLIPWALTYDCSVEPDAATPVWGRVGNDYASSDGDVLTISGTGTNLTYYYRFETFGDDIIWYRALVKVASACPRGHCAMLVRRKVGNPYAWVEIADGEVVFHVYPSHTYTEIIAMDTVSDFIDIMIKLTKTSVSIWVNDVLCWDNVSNNWTGADNEVFIFGKVYNTESSAAQYWDDVRYYFGPELYESSHTRGSISKLHRVMAIDYNIDEYTATVKLMDLYRMSSNCAFLGSNEFLSDELDWLTASRENKEKYLYLASSITDEFSNSDPGKGLCSST